MTPQTILLLELIMLALRYKLLTITDEEKYMNFHQMSKS